MFILNFFRFNIQSDFNGHFLKKIRILSHTPYVLCTLPEYWNETKLGNSFFRFNYTGDARHKAASLQVQLVFHYYPQAGNYLLPASSIVLKKSLAFYFEQWESFYHYPIPSLTFVGFTSRKTKMQCNYSQAIVPANEANQELYAYLGFPLIDSSDQIVVQDHIKMIGVKRFAVGQVSTGLPRKKSFITPAQRHTAEIIGTYCIDKEFFIPFY